MPKKILFLSFCVALFLLVIPNATNAQSVTKQNPLNNTQLCCLGGNFDTCINDAHGDNTEIATCIDILCIAGACSAAEAATAGGSPPAGAAAAAGSGGAPAAKNYDLPNFLATDEPADVIGRVIKAIIGVCGILSLIMFIYGGVLWLISAGRQAYVEKGRDTMLWSAIGLAVVFGSYILVNFVFTFFGK